MFLTFCVVLQRLLSSLAACVQYRRDSSVKLRIVPAWFWVEELKSDISRNVGSKPPYLDTELRWKLWKESELGRCNRRFGNVQLWELRAELFDARHIAIEIELKNRENLGT
jgi:hypothetical protein